jgi:hypothetical protein
MRGTRGITRVRARQWTSRTAVGCGFLAFVLLLSVVTLTLPSRTTAPTTTTTGTAPVQTSTGPTFPTPIQHVIVIMDENQNATYILNHDPFEAQLAHRYAYAGDFFAAVHNSPRDYVAATSGSTDDGFYQTQKNVGDLIDAANQTWAGYFESMPTNCFLNYNYPTGLNYTPGHNPFIRYKDIVENAPYCDSHVLNFTSPGNGFEAAVNSSNFPNYVWISPNDTDDDHNGTPLQGDQWLKYYVSEIQNSSFWSSTALFITYDEGAGTDDGPGGVGGGHIYTVLVSPYARMGYNSTFPYNTYSLLTTTEWLLGLGQTGDNDTWTQYPPMRDLFNLSSLYSVSGSITSTGHTAISGAILANSLTTVATTDPSGDYSLADLAPGSYNFTAEAPGYIWQTREITVTSSSLTGQDFSLAQCTVCVQAPIVNPSHVDKGQSIALSVNVTGGNGQYNYSWQHLPIGCASKDLPSYTCQVTQSAASGSTPIEVTANDPSGNQTSAPTVLYIDDDPILETPTASPASGLVEPGHAITFHEGVRTGGQGPFAYQWSDLPTGCTDSAAATDVCTPTASGTFHVNVTVIDANGYLVQATIPYTVLSGPAVSVLGAPSSIDLTQAARFQAIASGGSGGFSYSWSGLPAGCTGGSSATVSCTPTGTGTSLVQATVQDSSGGTGIGNLSFTIYPDPTIAPPHLSPSRVNVGAEVALTVQANGGLGPFSYNWSGLPVGCTGSGNNTTCVPSAAGTYEINVTATDQNGFAVTSGSTTLMVLAGLLVNVTLSPSAMDVGQSTSVNATVHGGTGPFAYAWSPIPGCDPSGAQFVCTPSAPGTYEVTVNASDTQGSWGLSLARSLVVSPALSVGVPVLSRINVDLGQSIDLSVPVSGGTSPYIVTWNDLPSGCALTQSSGACVAGSTGNFSIAVTVTDSLGSIVHSSIATLSVQSDPSIVTLDATPGQLGLGSSVQITGVFSGGVGPFSYNYTGLPGGCSPVDQPSLSCIPTAAGNYTVTLVMTDADGLTSNATVAFSVVPPSTGTAPPPSSPGRSADLLSGPYALFWEVGVAFAAFGATLAGFWLLRWGLRPKPTVPAGAANPPYRSPETSNPTAGSTERGVP